MLTRNFRMKVVLLSGVFILLLISGSATGQDDDVDPLRIVRLRRLTHAMENYVPSPIRRADGVEVYRDDSSGIFMNVEPLGVGLGRVLRVFADKHEDFDLTFVAVLRGEDGSKIEFYDGTAGSDDLRLVRLMQGDMLVIMSPVDADK